MSVAKSTAPPALVEQRALIVGVGAVGGPVVLALASAGVSRVRFCDPDDVELSNLQRQIQFTTGDVGANKARALARRLVARGVPDERIEASTARFGPETMDELLAGVDVVVDGSDNFETKFAVNDAAVARGMPAIIASAVATVGQIFASLPGGPCYRCLFESPPEHDRGNCAQVGILAPLPGVVAGHAASLALELLLGGCSRAPLAVLEHTATEPRWIDFATRDGCPAHPHDLTSSANAPRLNH